VAAADLSARREGATREREGGAGARRGRDVACTPILTRRRPFWWCGGHSTSGMGSRVFQMLREPSRQHALVVGPKASCSRGRRRHCRWPTKRFWS
jgi:hypothetical protein